MHNILHLTPMVDADQHSLILQCSCSPSIQIANFGVLIVVHRTINPVYDIPCAVETAKAILKNHER